MYIYSVIILMANKTIKYNRVISYVDFQIKQIIEL